MQKDNFESNVIWCFKQLLPILSNPGHEGDMYKKVNALFAELGFVDIGLPLFAKEYQVNRGIGGDDAVYNRDTPNLGLSFIGKSSITFVFNAHLDHYFSGKISTNYIEQDGCIVSEGDCILGADCKMGIAVIYAWAKELVGLSNAPSIDIVFDTCEEAGVIGMLEFINNKHYKMMPFHSRYKKNNPVFSYSLDGLWEKKWGDSLGCYITRNSAISLSNYIMVNRQERFCAVEGDRVFWKKFAKKERQLIKTLGGIFLEDIKLEKIKVMPYGASFVLLNKVVPTIMLPVGFYDCHTHKEYYELNKLKSLNLLSNFINIVETQGII